jgi:hypothetical protein
VYSAPAGTQFPFPLTVLRPRQVQRRSHAPAAAHSHHYSRLRPSDGVGCIRPDVSEPVRSASRQLVYTPYVICCETVLGTLRSQREGDSGEHQIEVAVCAAVFFGIVRQRLRSALVPSMVVSVESTVVPPMVWAVSGLMCASRVGVSDV